MTKATDMKDYSMYRYYKGEKENPFENLLNKAEIDKSNLPPPECMKYEYNLSENEVQKLQNSKMFWFYESVFERDFSKMENSDWFNFFNDYGLGDAFMKIASDGDYNLLTGNKKKQVFDLWLKYLFGEKLYGEYGGSNRHKELYYSLL